MRKQWPTLFLATLLAGCAVGPDYERPSMALPDEWPDEILLSDEERHDWQEWWRRYEDPALDRLVARALDDNLDIRLQMDRIRESRARLGLAEAERLPTVDAQAEAQRTRQSAAELGLDEDIDLTGTRNLFSITGVLGYEVDLWGRIQRQEEAAEAILEQSVFSHDAIRLNVIADVVVTYVNLLAAERRLAITERTAESRQRTLEIEEARYRGGQSDALVVRQAESELEATRAQLPVQREQVAVLRTALAVLVGMQPSELMDELDFGDETLTGMRLPEGMPGELPSELLRRRPDIRAAEAGLMASTAEIGVAQADRLPRLDLTGFLGTAAADTGDLFSSDAETWGLGASVVGPIFDFGRRRARVDTAEALQDQARTQYFMTITTAFGEVRDALNLYQTTQERVDAVRRQVEAQRETQRLATLRYDAGFVSFIELLDAQRALLDAELALAAAIRDRLNATATLFKVMGGGWEAPFDPQGS